MTSFVQKHMNSERVLKHCESAESNRTNTTIPLELFVVCKFVVY